MTASGRVSMTASGRVDDRLRIRRRLGFGFGGLPHHDEIRHEQAVLAHAQPDRTDDAQAFGE